MARPGNLAPRRDPQNRRTFFGYDPTKLTNPDPTKRYKFVDPSAKHEGIRSHEARGWEVVKVHKDGPTLVSGTEARDMEPVTLDDLVLMQIDRKTWERWEREGVHAVGGQQHLDDIEQQILSPAGIDGSARSTSYAEVINESKAPRSFSSAEL